MTQPQDTMYKDLYDMFLQEYQASTSIIETNNKDIARFEKYVTDLIAKNRFYEAKCDNTDKLLATLWKEVNPGKPYEHQKNAAKTGEQKSEV